MKYRILCLSIICLISSSRAQDLQRDDLPTFGEKPSLNFKLAPLTMTEPYYNTFEGGIEYKFHPQYAIQAQFGYGDSKRSIYPYDETWDGVFRTYRSRLEGRYYLRGIRMKYPVRRRLARFNPELLNSDAMQRYNQERRKLAHPYWAIELGWKNTVFFEEGFVGRGCSQGVCDYQEYSVYRRRKNVGLLYFKYGKQRFYSRNFFLDYYVGVGLRYVHIDLTDQEWSAFPFFDDVFFNRIDARDPGSFFILGIAGGIKLGYSIGLKK